MIIDFNTQSETQKYHLMTNVIVPRPIAWVVTEGEVINIAPFSYFTALSSEPATVVISIGNRDDGSPKDTLRNLRESKKCVICIVDEEHFAPMHKSAAGLEPNESEMEAFDIESNIILDNFPPVPTGIKAAMFGEYLKEVDLVGRTTPIIIEIKHIYVNESIIIDKEKMKLEFNTIARMGGDYRFLGSKVEP